MNESVGYTVTINIIITFIIIVFVFITNALIYYKSNKVGNLITDSIEKYSGFNDLSLNEVSKNLDSIGYNKTKINCSESISGKNNTICNVVRKDDTQPNGYCVYECDAANNYYYYKVKANMIINIPILNEMVNGSVFSSTENMYNYGGVEKPKYKYESESGDANDDGKIDSNDWDLIREYLSGKTVDINLEAADVNGDGEVDIDDVTQMQIIANSKNNEGDKK